MFVGTVLLASFHTRLLFGSVANFILLVPTHGFIPKFLILPRLKLHIVGCYQKVNNVKAIIYF